MYRKSNLIFRGKTRNGIAKRKNGGEWLCLMQLNRFGLHYSRKGISFSRQLPQKLPNSFPLHQQSAIIDSCILCHRQWKETFHRKLLLVGVIHFTPYNTSDHNSQLKWIHCLKDAALNTERSLNAPSRRKWQPFSIAHKELHGMAAASFMHACGLFKEVKDKGSKWEAVGVIEGTSEAIFAHSCVGQSRLDCVVEHLDGHTDIKRDLLLQRYWRREKMAHMLFSIILSFTAECPPQNGYVCGGHVITPTKHDKPSIVKHMIAIDWKLWKPYMKKGIKRDVQSKGRNYFSSCHRVCLDMRDIDLHVSEKEEIKIEVDYKMITDERESYHTKLPTNIVKKLHDLTSYYMDLQEMARGSRVCVILQWNNSSKDQSFGMPYNWAAADPSSFLIRADSYLADQEKVKAKSTLMQMVAADWLRYARRENDLASRPEIAYLKFILQCTRYASRGRRVLFIINITTTYNLALYYMLTSPLEETPLLERFVNGDDSFRNSRFKFIPYISKAASVGKKACLVGQALEVHYFRGRNYLEGNAPEELLEFHLGTCRLNHLGVSKSIQTNSLSII
ncbi:hypothetical protein R3W88_011717 [Solanum pinnatisectum]|uniref:Protein ENHANCED DISEASE RESISTANCE 2 C-terminal domain-containing protein n=1 Tax=Solanum pinnatisectum TaxID=50273 RepID=A0AAV9L848_9SOLN|nr:hypothetical protein R3W88_011717 [Solanum pinnatisectum]